MSPAAAAATMPAVSRAGVAGTWSTSQTRGDLGAGRGVARPGGHRAGAHRARRPRGHRAPPPDAAPTRAGHRWSAARSAAARSAPGERGEALTDEDDAARGEGRRARRVGRAEVGQGRGLVAGHGRQQGAAHLGQAARRRGTRRHTPASCACGRPCAGAGRRSGSRPRARSRRGGRPWRPRGRRTSTAPPSGPVAATCSARKATSSAECGRARKSTSLVPSTTRANLP